MSASADAALVFEAVEKRYGPTVALSGASFRVAEGSCHGLVGPNGAGKTTAFGLAAGLLGPTSGRLLAFGRDPRDRGTARPRIGVLPQDAALPPGLVVGPRLASWARLSGEARPEIAARLVLDRVGLPEVWDAHPRELSHGMTKRVALAQALLGSPRLLLLDEPTAGLDPRAAAEVRGLLAGLRGVATLVVSSHDLGELERLCDAVTVLDKGRVVQDGPLAELTGRGSEFTVRIARGDVPLAEVRALAGVAEASLSTAGALTVRLGRDAPPVEDVIAEVLGLLLTRGVRPVALGQGSSLEQRVLAATAPRPVAPPSEA